MRLRMSPRSCCPFSFSRYPFRWGCVLGVAAWREDLPSWSWWALRVARGGFLGLGLDSWEYMRTMELALSESSSRRLDMRSSVCLRWESMVLSCCETVCRKAEAGRSPCFSWKKDEFLFFRMAGVLIMLSSMSSLKEAHLMMLSSIFATCPPLPFSSGEGECCSLCWLCRRTGERAADCSSEGGVCSCSDTFLCGTASYFLETVRQMGQGVL